MGDIGLFTQCPSFIKESARTVLSAYELITGTEDDPIHAQGKIIGMCSEDYLQ